jgi:hypothetical protein
MTLNGSTYGACARCTPKRMSADVMVVRVVLTLALLLSSVLVRAQAQDGVTTNGAAAAASGELPAPTPEPTAAPVISYEFSAGSEWLIKAGSDRKPTGFARGQADAEGAFGAHLFGRVDATAEQDGGTVSLADPKTFSALEVTAGAYRQAWGPFRATVFYGEVVTVIGGKAVVQRNPHRVAGGVFVGDPRSGTWLLLSVGQDQTTGAGTRFLFAGQYRIRPHVYATADGSIGGQASQARGGIAYGSGAQWAAPGRSCRCQS